MVHQLWLFVIFLSLVLCISASYTARNLDNVANPMKDPLSCGRQNVTHSAVCDPDNILKRDFSDELEGYINGISEAGLAEIAVVAINHMDLKSLSADSDVDRAAEKLARGLHDMWGIGSKEKNDGILVLLSIKDRSIYISTGQGVDDRLTTMVIKDIIGSMKSSLREAKYGEALATCLIAIDYALSSTKEKKTGYLAAAYAKYPPTLSISGKDESNFFQTWGPPLFLASILLFTLLFKFMNENKLKRYERSRESLNRILRDVTESNSSDTNKFSSSSCPICLEDFNHTNECVEIHGQPSVNPTPADRKRPVSLAKCGHVFCAVCIEEYLRSQQNGNCPICRVPIMDDAPAVNQRAPAPPIHRNSSSFLQFRPSFNLFRSRHPYDYTTLHTNGGGVFTTTTTVTETQSPIIARNLEWRFRLHRMHYLYPDMFPAEVLRSANIALNRGNLHDFREQLSARSVEIQRLSTELRNNLSDIARGSGSRGSSRSSFGGGRSRGGGGGRW